MNTVVIFAGLAGTILGFMWVYYIFKLIGLIGNRESSLNSTSGISLFFSSLGHIVGSKWKHDDFLEIKSHCVKMRFVLFPFMASFTFLTVYMFNLANA